MKLMKAHPSKVILHCSASPDYGKLDDKFDSITADKINAWHIARGFEKICYHFVVRRTGKLETGRFLDQFSCEIGAHTIGHNHDSLGICLVGTRKFTDEQMKTLVKLAKELKLLYGIGKNSWHGHCEFAAKECPGISMDYVKNLFDF